jgi:integrase
MASVVTPQRGSLIVKVIIDGTPRHIRVGHRDKKSAHNFARRVESLLSSRLGGTEPAPAVAAWLATLPQSMRTKLAKAGLIDDTGAGVTLAEHLDGYIARRTDWKPATKEGNERTRDLLTDRFGQDVLLSDITPSQAESWRNWLKDDKGMAEATARGHVRHAKAMFGSAVKDKLVPDNAFASLPSSSIPGERGRHINDEGTIDLIAACPNLQWRTLVGLARYAGLRCPSETHGLRWQDIDWDQARMNVRSPKTERHAGHEQRSVPIVPELMAILQHAFDAAPDGAEEVVTLSTNNLRRNLHVIMKRAGINPPVGFQVLRQSCETGWAQEYPQYAVSQWMGHSIKVSEKHYLTVPDELLKRVVAGAPKCAPESAPALRRTDAHGSETVEKQQENACNFTQDDADCCNATRKWPGPDLNRRHPHFQCDALPG